MTRPFARALAVLVALGMLAAPAQADVLVSVGDSYSSGEGSRNDRHPSWDEPTGNGFEGNGCHRGPNAWPRRLGVTADRHLACSGARTMDVLSRGQKDTAPDDVAQIERLRQLDRRIAIDTVLLTIGGNDIRFAKKIRACFVGRRCLHDLTKLDRELEELEARLVDTYRQVSRATRGDLVIVGYPDIFPARGERFTGCGWLGENERYAIRERTGVWHLQEGLDRTLEQAADKANVDYVSIRDALDGHEMCTKDGYVNKIRLTGSDRGHPNSMGQQLMAQAVRRGLKELHGNRAAAARRPVRTLQRQLDALVKARGGPPGAIVTLRRGARVRVLTAGVGNVKTRRAPRANDHVRIASVSKAFSGAVALRLVADGKLALDDTVGELRPDLPVAWSAVTLRQLLNHTSGLPDYTRSESFAKQFSENPGGYVSPTTLIDWVRSDPLVFAPGSRYEYSNTDNIVVGLMAERVGGTSYARLLRQLVFGPLGLRETSLPSRTALPRPFIHGYVIADDEGATEDVSTLLNPAGAWASGGIVSTPANLNRFMGAYLGARLFPAKLQREQLRFVPGGESSPPGPGRNAAGLAVFRYRTRCGTVFGHTGNFPGYVQFAAATRDGRRSLTTSLNIPAPEGRLLARLRAMQATAVCALLR